METSYWQPGDQVVIRNLEEHILFRAVPSLVVEDTSMRTVLYCCLGTQYVHRHRKRINGRIVYGFTGPFREPWSVIDWHTHNILMLFYPGKRYAVWVMWVQPSGEFVHWYVCLQSRFRRTAIGFDVQDHDLDIIVQSDLSWRWKDEDDVRALVAHGCWTQKKADLVRRDGLEVVRLIESQSAPFNEGWESWRPDPSWTLPVLPPNWCDVPVESVAIY